MLRKALIFGLICVVACDGDNSNDGESDTAGGTESGGSTSGGDTNATTAPEDDDGGGSMTASDTATTDMTTSPATTQTTTSATTASSSTTDDTATTTDGSESSGGGSDSSGEQGGGTIDVTLDGCDIDFGGTVVVSYNGSLGVGSIYDQGATLSGSFQFDLDGPATFMLSSQHRVDTGTVINMVDSSGTWTNIDGDSFGGGVDRIGGTLVVDTWNPSAGEASIAFQSVSLLHVSSGNVCTINGTIVAEELYP